MVSAPCLQHWPQLSCQPVSDPRLCIAPFSAMMKRYSNLNNKLLLLNIARTHNGMPVHFTTTSSIAATFDWTTTAGIGGTLEEGPGGLHSLNLNLGASASETPTFSITPLSGSEFTKRILTPLDEKIFEFIIHQGVPIDLVMRLVSGGIMEMKPDGKFVRFIENHPRRRNEYTELR